MIIKVERLIRKGYSGFALYPFIFLRPEYLDSEQTILHERIHLAQQKEMLILPFLIWYFTEYAWRRLQHGSWKEAYHAISFEREAYAYDCEKGYLKTRKAYAWWGMGKKG